MKIRSPFWVSKLNLKALMLTLSSPKPPIRDSMVRPSHQASVSAVPAPSEACPSILANARCPSWVLTCPSMGCICHMYRPCHLHHIFGWPISVTPCYRSDHVPGLRPQLQVCIFAQISLTLDGAYCSALCSMRLSSPDLPLPSL